MSLGLNSPVLCDCVSRRYCRYDDNCNNSFVGSYVEDIYDCRYGFDCGFRVISNCTCYL
jgi:hypothetical protein